MYNKIFIFSLIFFAFSSCKLATIELEEGNGSAWNKLPVTYAKGFRIWEKNGAYRLELRNPNDTAVVLQRIKLDKKETNDSEILTIPVSNFALGSTTFIPYFDKLNVLNSVSGCTHLGSIKNERVHRVVATNNWVELAPGGDLDLERVVSIAPLVFFTYSVSDLDFEVFSSTKVQPILNFEYLESHPLARAEWLLVLGCLTDQLDESKAAFDVIETKYNDLKNRAMLSSYIPKVLIGNRYADRWYAPGGQSYIAQILHDASATYSFDFIAGTGSQELDYEVVLNQLNQADFWGMVISHEGTFTKQDILLLDPELSEIPAMTKDHVFICNSAITDYFVEAALEPEIVLADIIKILRPTYLPNHQAKYFRPIP